MVVTGIGRKKVAETLRTDCSGELRRPPEWACGSRLIHSQLQERLLAPNVGAELYTHWVLTELLRHPTPELDVHTRGAVCALGDDGAGMEP
jgi:hypothetical protein